MHLGGGVELSSTIKMQAKTSLITSITAIHHKRTGSALLRSGAVWGYFTMLSLLVVTMLSANESCIVNRSSWCSSMSQQSPFQADSLVYFLPPRRRGLQQPNPWRPLCQCHQCHLRGVQARRTRLHFPFLSHRRPVPGNGLDQLRGRH